MVGKLYRVRGGMSQVGDYSDFQIASGQGVIQEGEQALSDCVMAFDRVTNNGANLKALTYDSFVRAMSDGATFAEAGRSGTTGYPVSQIQKTINTAWPFLPANIRAGLSKREPKPSPAVPPPANPSANTPVHSNVKTQKYASGGLGKTALYIGGGIVAIVAAVAVGRGARR